MSKTAEDVLKVLEIEAEITPEMTDEQFEQVVKESAGKKYIDQSLHKAEIGKAIGKVKGEAETKFRQIVGDEGKGKNYDELIKMVGPAYESKIKSFEEQLKEAKESGNKGDISEAEKKLAAAIKERDSFKEIANGANSKIEELTASYEEKLKNKDTEHVNYKNSLKLSAIYDSMPWPKDTSKYTKDGFYRNEIDSKYTFKEENGQFMVYEADGETPHTGGGTSHMKADELFKGLLKKANLLAVNGSNGSKEADKISFDLSGIDNPVIKANFNKAQAHLEKLKKATQG